jgi:hypothetical protein
LQDDHPADFARKLKERAMLVPVSYAVLAGLMISATTQSVSQAPTPPQITQIMGEGVVSLPDRYEFCSTLTADGQTLYIGIEHGAWQSIEVHDWTDKGWGPARHVIGRPDFSAHDPYLTPDEQRLYFITRVNGNADIAYLPRQENGQWGEPVLLNAPVNTATNEYYSTFTRAGDLVFSSDRNGGGYDLYRASPNGEGFNEPVAFPSPVNTRAYEGDPYIDPDENYLIFASSRRRSLGRGDLFISYPDGEDGWTYPTQFDERINTEGHQLCPMLTNDGQGLMFISEEEIRWIDISILDDHPPQSAPE